MRYLQTLKKKLHLLFLALVFVFSINCAVVFIPNLLPQKGSLSEVKVVKSKRFMVRNKILILDINGIISSIDTDSIFGLGRENTVEEVKDRLTKAEEDPNIKALILRLNSPGGEVTSSDIIYQEIKKYKEKTGVKIVACLMDLGTSGTYYIAVSADKIIAHPTTVTGSIGVITQLFNVKKLAEKLGVDFITIKSDDKKDMGSLFRTLTDEEKAIFQNLIDTMFNRFIDIVDEGRTTLTREEIRKLADGRVFTAKEALENKLIDQIGYMDDAIELAKKEAGISDANVIFYKRPREYKSNIYSSSEMSFLKPQINLININLGELLSYSRPQFFYIWNPN